MGLQFRKRTKGKNSWINVSHSKKNGLSASLSVKLDKNLTMNFGGKGNRRATINFGNGIRYVKYRTPKTKEKKVSEPRSRSRRSSTTYTPTYTREELLGVCHSELLRVGKQIQHDDAEYLVDLYNAISEVKYYPITLDTRDLVIVTTNNFIDAANRSGNEETKEVANAVSKYLRGLMPDRPKPVVIKEESFNKPLVWGTIIGLCLLIAMCSA